MKALQVPELADLFPETRLAYQGCLKKDRYERLDVAERVCQRQQARTQKALRIYGPCPECAGYHLTSREMSPGELYLAREKAAMQRLAESEAENTRLAAELAHERAENDRRDRLIKAGYGVRWRMDGVDKQGRPIRYGYVYMQGVLAEAAKPLEAPEPPPCVLARWD